MAEGMGRLTEYRVPQKRSLFAVGGRLRAFVIYACYILGAAFRMRRGCAFRH